MRIYASQASKRNYWREEDSAEARNSHKLHQSAEWCRQLELTSRLAGERDNPKSPVPLQSRAELGDTRDSLHTQLRQGITADTQISKFYRKYPNWRENEKGEYK